MITLLLAATMALSGNSSELSVVVTKLPGGSIADLSETNPIEFRFKLTNRSKRPLKLWDPHNTEGSMCVFAVLTNAKQQQIELESLPIPRAGGIPTAIQLAPGSAIEIRGDFRWSVGIKRLPAGTYRWKIVYRSLQAESGPVKGVWTGSSASAPFDFRLIP